MITRHAYFIVLFVIGTGCSAVGCAGDVRPAELIARLPSGDCARGEACAIDLGEADVGSVAGTAFDLVNLGDEDVTVLQADVIGDPAYRLLAAPDEPIAGGASEPLAFIVEPDSARPITATVFLVGTDNDAPLEIDVGITGRTSFGDLSFAPTSCEFGEVTVGTTSLPCTITLENNGLFTLELTIETSAPFSGDGVVPVPMFIEPGTSTSFGIRASPAVAGEVTGSLAFIIDTAVFSGAVSLRVAGVP